MQHGQFCKAHSPLIGWPTSLPHYISHTSFMTTDISFISITHQQITHFQRNLKTTIIHFHVLIHREWLTCCTSAAVLRNSSMYLFPRICLCFFREFWAYSSQEKSTKASPVGRPSGYLTKRRPSAPSVTGLSGPRNASTSCAVAVKGSPRIRMITWFSLDRNWATSLEVPGDGEGGDTEHLNTSLG